MLAMLLRYFHATPSRRHYRRQRHCFAFDTLPCYYILFADYATLISCYAFSAPLRYCHIFAADTPLLLMRVSGLSPSPTPF